MLSGRSRRDVRSGFIKFGLNIDSGWIRGLREAASGVGWRPQVSFNCFLLFAG